MFTDFRGLKIIQDNNMVNHHEDWSEVRSPSRAKRRMSKHKQRIKRWVTPKKDVFVTATSIIGHPTTIHQMKKMIEDEHERNSYNQFCG